MTLFAIFERRLAFAVVIGLSALAAGCTQQLSRTFDNTPDPELQRPGVYPNINIAGGKPQGKLMTPDELAKATADLKAKGARNDPRPGAAALKASAASTPALTKSAATHGQTTLDAIKKSGCADKTAAEKTAADATKCPQ